MALRWRDVGSLALCVLVGWLALGPLPRIPGLAVVDLGFASLGHLGGEFVRQVVATPLPPALGGLVLPVAVPLALAVVFIRSRNDRHAGALCLAWAAAVLTAAAADVVEAAEPGPARAGGPHDWAVLLGPQGLHALGRAADVSGALRTGAAVLLVAGVVACIAPLIVAAVRALHEPTPAPTAWNGPNRRRL